MSDLTERVAAWDEAERRWPSSVLHENHGIRQSAFVDGWGAALAAVADAPGLAEVLRAHRTSLVTCAGKIAGAACSCDWQTDHGWSPKGAQKRADQHLTLVVRAWLRGEFR